MGDSKAIFDAMVEHFDVSAAADIDAVFQFELDDTDNYFISINEGKCDLSSGEHDDATVTLAMELATLEKVMNGELDGMAAFMQGKIRAEGDVMLATRLTDIFPI